MLAQVRVRTRRILESRWDSRSQRRIGSRTRSERRCSNFSLGFPHPGSQDLQIFIGPSGCSKNSTNANLYVSPQNRSLKISKIRREFFAGVDWTLFGFSITFYRKCMKMLTPHYSYLMIFPETHETLWNFPQFEGLGMYEWSDFDSPFPLRPDLSSKSHR